MGRAKRAVVSGKADRHAAELAGRLGRSLADARRRIGMSQAAAAARAGISQSGWSRLESDLDARVTIATWDRAAHAVGTVLNAYLPQASAADQPRDAVHLKTQELILRTSEPGGWSGLAEEAIDREVGASRWADVLLSRRRPAAPQEYCIFEVLDWVPDVGGGVRDFARRLDRLDRYAVARMVGDEPVATTSGCWVLRATQRNRRLVGEHRHFFRGRFPGSGRAWLDALTDPTVPMPTGAALLWVAVSGERLFPARLG